MVYHIEWILIGDLNKILGKIDCVIFSSLHESEWDIGQCFSIFLNLNILNFRIRSIEVIISTYLYNNFENYHFKTICFEKTIFHLF